jgi:hypothetical protein
MLVSERKPLEEILGLLEREGRRRLFILGCNGCAAASGTGGEPEVLELKEELERAGKEVVGWKVLDFLCQKGLIRAGLRPYEKELAAAEAVLAATCGIGVQAVAAVLERKRRASPFILPVTLSPSAGSGGNGLAQRGASSAANASSA